MYAIRSYYGDSLGPLGDGLIAECGIQEIGLAGYPEGHARIPRAALERAMDEKLAMARITSYNVCYTKLLR